MEKEALLECGKIVNTHGTRGTLKIESWCDTPEILCGIKTLYYRKREELVSLSVTHTSVHKGYVLADIEGIDSMEKAELLKNRIVLADRAEIPLDDDRVFVADLLGLDVVDARDGKKLGVLEDMIENPGSDLFCVKTPEGKEVLVPAVDEFIDHVVDKALYLSLIPGFFDDEAEETDK